MSAIKSPLCWYGGKFRMRRKIIERFPEHRTYVEPFCGAAWVLFGKERSEIEVIADLNLDLMIFWGTLRNQTERLISQIDSLPKTREYFEHIKRTFGKERIQLSAYFYFLNRFSYSGVGKNWSNGKAQRDSYFRPDVLRRAAERLAGVKLLYYDWSTSLDKHDSKDTLFFLDPPYHHTKAQYNYLHSFKTEDFVKLSERLKRIKGKFLLTINDHPEIREMFKDFNCEEIEHYYSAHHGPVRRKVTELIYTNYEKENK